MDNQGCMRSPPCLQPKAWSTLSEPAWSLPFGPSPSTPASPTHSHQASREVKWSGVVGSGLRGGEVTNAAALAQFLLQ